jgi:hypothetical protein
VADQVIIAEIKQHHRLRCFAMDQRQCSDLRLGSMLRMQLGWRKDLPESDRKRIAAQAKTLMDADEPEQFEHAIIATRLARKPFEKMEHLGEREMALLAKMLPVWADFAEPIRGFGAVSLAVIVAEAGDLSDYASHGKLWKRMGLAPGQNRVPAGLNRKDYVDAWKANKYSPRRRSRMWQIGETMIKAQVRQVKDADGKDTGERVALGPYGESYLRRKLHTQKTHPEWWRDKDGNEKVDKKTGRAMSEHGNLDAQRYMEKRLLRDLWRAWRRLNRLMANRPNIELAAASIQTDEAGLT